MKPIAAVVTLALAALVAAALLYHSETLNKGLLANKARCAHDGAQWLSAHFENIPGEEYFIYQSYAYSPELHTCLVDFERKSIVGIEYGISDVYSNNSIAGYNLDSTSYDNSSTTNAFRAAYEAARHKYFSE